MPISSDKPRHRLVAGAYAILMLMGLGWGGYSLTTIDTDELNTASVWLDGSAGKTLNHALKLPWQSEITDWSAAVRYRLFGDLGPQVAQGCPGWLFYRDGLRPPPGTDPKVFDARLQLMRGWTKRLHERGVQVLVVAVPDKSRIEAGQLCGLHGSDAMPRRLDSWQDALRKEGVPYVDLRPALQAASPAFFRTDVHMNRQGAAAAANAVAEKARQFLPVMGNVKYSDHMAKPKERIGDLLVLAGLVNVANGWRPAPDIVPEETITAQRSVGLLDDGPPVEILLAGSSNGRRSAFAERLGRHLGREIWNLSMDGGQFSGALVAAFKREPQWPKSLKLVIWEFSESALSQPLTEDEKQALAGLSPTT